MPRLTPSFRPLQKSLIVVPVKPPATPHVIIRESIHSKQRILGLTAGFFGFGYTVLPAVFYLGIVVDEPDGDSKAWVFTKNYLYGTTLSIVILWLFFVIMSN